jgi:SSS family solute:Na+ symporter
VNAAEVSVFCSLFVLIALIGVYAPRWRAGNLRKLDEWGLAGRRLGSFVTWFLQGGSLYTVYAFVAVPAHVYGAGAIGFFSVGYGLVIYPISYLVLPRLWQVAKDRGYVTAADYVRDRFDSSLLATVVALTGIAATMPYIALQVYGIEVCVAQLGVPVEASLAIAFAVLAGITYVAGLRSAALIAVAKDVLIWGTVLLAAIYLPLHLGGYGHVLHQVPPEKFVLPSGQYVEYVTLIMGSALALWLYPHALTGTFSASSQDVIRRNAVFLPLYTVMLAILAMLAYMALAAGVRPSEAYGANSVVPELFDRELPSALAGFGLAAIAIGGLVPAAVMSIAAANLFSRNVYKAFLRRDAADEAVATVAKRTSLVVKIGAVVFILVAPAKYVVNFQLAGGVWILQTLPAVFLALFLRRLDRRAIVAGWAVGIAFGTAMLSASSFEDATRHFDLLGSGRVYVALPALALNLAVVFAGTALAGLLAPRGEAAPTAGS